MHVNISKRKQVKNIGGINVFGALHGILQKIIHIINYKYESITYYNRSNSLFLAIIAGGIVFLAVLEESLTEDINESILKDKKDNGTDQQ